MVLKQYWRLKMIMTTNQFMDKLTSIKGGESFVYFTGSLAVVADTVQTAKDLRDLVYRIATQINPLGYLTQRTHPSGSEYIFTKKKDIHVKD